MKMTTYITKIEDRPAVAAPRSEVFPGETPDQYPHRGQKPVPAGFPGRDRGRRLGVIRGKLHRLGTGSRRNVRESNEPKAYLCRASGADTADQQR